METVVIVLIVLVLNSVINWLYVLSSPKEVIKYRTSIDEYSKSSVNYKNIKDIQKDYLKKEDIKELKTLRERLNKLELEKINPKFKRNVKVYWDNGFYMHGINSSLGYWMPIKQVGKYLSREMDLKNNKWMCKVLMENDRIEEIEEDTLQLIKKK